MELAIGVLAGGKRREREADCSHPSSAEAKNVRTISTSTDPSAGTDLPYYLISDVHEFCTDMISYSFKVVFFCKGRIKNTGFCSGFLRFWTLSIVRYSNEHKVSGTGSVSILI
jgi:hypothetical protein